MRPLLLSLLLALPGSLFASVDPALLALVPAGSRLITGLDASHARSSSFGQYILSRVHDGDSQFQQLIEQTGFDPRRDLESLVFATQGGNRNGQFILLARGIFDPDRIKAAAVAHGASLQNYADANLYVGQKQSPATAFAFLDATTVALGDLDTLKQVLDNRGVGSALDPTLQAELKRANEANDLWFVSNLPPSLLASRLPQEAGSDSSDRAGALQGILESDGGIRFGDTVRLSLDAITRSPQDATSLADLLRFLASAVQMGRNSDPRAAILASSLDSMTLTRSGSQVHAGLSLPENNLERLIDLGSRPRESGRLSPAPPLQ